jgi:hypothetical protein
MTDKPEKSNAMPLVAAVGMARGTLLDSEVEFGIAAGRVVAVACPFNPGGFGWPYAELTRDVEAGEEITPENAVLRPWSARNDARPISEPLSWRQKPGLF